VHGQSLVLVKLGLAFGRVIEYLSPWAIFLMETYDILSVSTESINRFIQVAF
jgi:hypothetical protein